MLRPFLAFLLICFISHCAAQGYVIVGDSLKQGKVHRNGNSSITYYENGYRNGTDYPLKRVMGYREKYKVFEAVVVDGDRKFYRRLTDGTVTLYKSGFHYALKSGDTATVIRRNNFRTEVNRILKLNASQDELARLTYSQPALMAVVTQNDYVGSGIKNIPYRKFGIVVGYNLLQFKSTPYLITLSKNVAVPSIGVFADLPLSFKKNKWYLTPEVNVMKYQTAFYQQDNNGHSNFMALNLQNINMLGSVKWVGDGSIKPYGKVGLIASATKAECPTGLIATTKDGSNVYVNHLPLPDSQKALQFGANAAAGVQIPVGGRKNIHVEVRYTKSLNSALSDFKLNVSNIGICAGFNL
jgi:hypothetical protein